MNDFPQCWVFLCFKLPSLTEGQQYTEHEAARGKCGLNQLCRHPAGGFFPHSNRTVNRHNGPERATATERFRGGGCIHTMILILIWPLKAILNCIFLALRLDCMVVGHYRKDCNLSLYENLKSTKHIPHLDRDRHGAAGPNVAQARLLDQLTPGIVIGNTRGDAHPAAPRTLRPGSSLNHTLISHLPPG